MKKFFKYFLWFIVAALFVGTFVYLYLNSRQKEDVFATVSPSRATIERTTVLTGKIEPRDEIDVKPQISGIVSSIEVEAGDFVSAGDIIARIKVIPDASQLSSAQSRVNNARIELDDARLKLDRSQTLFDRKVISREEYEDALKAYGKAEEELQAASDACRIVSEGVSRYNAAQSNTEVRATITGLVLDVPVKVGSSVIQANTMNDGTTVATIADMSNLIFKGNVDETEVGLLSIGMVMDIAIGALPDRHPTAVIEYISPKGSSASGANSFEIKAALSIDDPAGLRAGYSANGSLVIARAENVLTVPEGVVEFAGDSTFVYVMADSLPSPSYRRTPVVTGLSDGIRIEVKSGIDSTAVIRGDKISQN